MGVYVDLSKKYGARPPGRFSGGRNEVVVITVRVAKSGRQAGATLPPLPLLAPGDGGDKPSWPRRPVSQAVKQPVTDYLEFTGNTQAINTVQLKARVEGYLEKVFFKDGDQVKKGQLLFLIQHNTYEAAQQAEAEILAQKAKLPTPSTEYARFTKLVTQKAAAQTDWTTGSTSGMRPGRGHAAEAQRDLARLNLSYTRVTAPFDGRIGRRLKDPGNLVGAAKPPSWPMSIRSTPSTSTSPSTSTTSWKTKEPRPVDTRRSVTAPDPVPGPRQRRGLSPQGLSRFRRHHLTPTTGTRQLRGIFPNLQLRDAAGPVRPHQGPHRGLPKRGLAGAGPRPWATISRDLTSCWWRRRI